MNKPVIPPRAANNGACKQTTNTAKTTEEELRVDFLSGSQKTSSTVHVTATHPGDMNATVADKVSAGRDNMQTKKLFSPRS
jgi:hypothetical protein